MQWEREGLLIPVKSTFELSPCDLLSMDLKKSWLATLLFCIFLILCCSITNWSKSVTLIASYFCFQLISGNWLTIFYNKHCRQASGKPALESVLDTVNCLKKAIGLTWKYYWLNIIENCLKQIFLSIAHCEAQKTMNTINIYGMVLCCKEKVN